MKLSDAIEKGCKGREQFFGNMIDAYEAPYRVCAMGAALLAIGKTANEIELIEFSGEKAIDFGWNRETVGKVMKWNDDGHYTFKTIINRLRKQGE